jgi:hypothetical protein
MNGPEVRARLSLDSSQFNASIEGANKKVAKIFGKGFGAGRGSMLAFAGISEAIEESNGSFKQFTKNMAATGIMAAGIIGIAKAWEFLGNTFKEVDANLKEFGAKGKFGTFLWTLGIGGLEFDKMKQQENADKDRQDSISRAAKALKGPDAEERVLRWMRANKVTAQEDSRIAERLRMEQEKDAAKSIRGETRVDQYARVGLGVAYGGAVDFARRTADNTSAMVQLLQDFVSGRLTVVNGVPAAQ